MCPGPFGIGFDVVGNVHDGSVFLSDGYAAGMQAAGSVYP
jgi:hypothetical protein